MKKPSEKRIKELFGSNQEKAKRYRRGWYNAGQVIQRNLDKKMPPGEEGQMRAGHAIIVRE